MPKISKIPKIVSGIVVTILAIALGWFLLSPFWFWVSLEVVAAVLVAVGCSGEWWLHHHPAGREKIKKEEHHKLESRFISMVSIGVIVEVFALGHSIREGKKLEDNVAQLESTNLVLRANVVKLEQQIMETSNDVVKSDLKNDDLKKPISSVSAIVSLWTRGLRSGMPSMLGLDFSTTNLVAFDPLRGERIDLAYGRPEGFVAGLPTMFLAQGERPTSSSDGTNTLWTLNLVQVRSISSFPKGNVESKAEWNLFEIEASFLPRNTEVLGGKITLTINLTPFEIPIPPQIAKSRELDWQNFLDNPQTNVTVFGQ